MVDKNKKVSIIVPVYNVEKYLQRCIESILTQTETDFELLLIDDGSKDKSGLICDEYAQKDERVNVIHKENGGVSSARNLGIEKANGEWICFIDADDYVRQDFLSDIQQYLFNDVDIVHWGFCYDNCGMIVEKPIVNKTNIMNMEEVCKKDLFHGYVWSYLFKRDIIEKNRIKFHTDLKYAEDWLFILTYYTKAHKMAALSSCFYTQVFRPDSATNVTLGEKYIKDNFEMYKRVLAGFRNLHNVYRRFLQRMLVGINIWLVNNVLYKDKKYNRAYREAWQKLDNYRFKYHPIIFLPLCLSIYSFNIFVRIYKRICF